MRQFAQILAIESICLIVQESNHSIANMSSPKGKNAKKGKKPFRATPALVKKINGFILFIVTAMGWLTPFPSLYYQKFIKTFFFRMCFNHTCVMCCSLQLCCPMHSMA